MSILGNLETMGAEVIEALKPTPAPGSVPKSLSSDDIAKTLPALSAVIAWLAKESPTIQAGATIAERLAALAAMFDVPGAADAALVRCNPHARLAGAHAAPRSAIAKRRGTCARPSCASFPFLDRPSDAIAAPP